MEVVIEKPELTRLDFLVDPATSLPFELTQSRFHEGAWHVTGPISFEFNIELLKEIFTPESLRTPYGPAHRLVKP